jgi:hypothetical protein
MVDRESDRSQKNQASMSFPVDKVDVFVGGSKTEQLPTSQRRYEPI